MDPSSSSSSLFSSSKSRHTFLDLISSSLTEEDKHKLIHEFHQKNSLFNTGLMETYLAAEPLLLSLFLILLFLSLSLFCLAVVVSVCRFLGKCGGRRYQPFPHSSRRFLFLTLSFLFSWLLLASSTLNFILSTASFYGQRNPSQLVSVPIKSLNLDYPDYDRGKRESILTALFNDPDYDFDKVDELPEETTTTTTASSFITETTRSVVPIGGEGRRGDPIVVVTHNEDIEENGQPREKELIDPVEEENDGDEEEYIEEEDGDDDDIDRTTTKHPQSPITRLPPVPPTRPTVPSTRPTVPTPTKDPSPHWVSRIGEGEEWDEILSQGQHLPPATTRRITIHRVVTTTPTTTTTTEPSTTTTERTTRITTTPSTTTTTQTTTTSATPRSTTRRRTIPTTTQAPTTTTQPSTSINTHPQIPDYPEFDGFEVPTTTEGTAVGTTTTTTVSTTRRPVQSNLPPQETVPTLTVHESSPPSLDYSPFDRFDPTLNGIPAISSHPSNDLPDYISFNDVDAIPIQIGRIPQKGTVKSGRPNLSLLSHRRQFSSLHTDSYRSTNRFFGLLLALVLIVATLPSLLLVVLGAMYYTRGSHPMDRSKLSDIVGVLSVMMSLFIFFVVPLLLLYSSIGLLFSHTHHTLCPLVQPPTDTLEDVVLVMEGCARVQTPLIRMAQSSLLAAVSAFPVAVLLLQLSNYFLRMRREHYWTHSDNDLM